MKVEIRPPCPLEMFGEERIEFNLSSVAVWVIVMQNDTPAYYLAVQQAEKPGMPWGVPAGKVSESDNTISDVGIRELREETGLEVDPDEMSYLHWSWEYYGADRGHLIYGVMVDIDRFVLDNPRRLDDGTVLFDPPSQVNRREIRQLALIPLELTFRPNILNRNAYHPQETYRGLIALRSRGVIDGSFGFENDPGL